MSDAKVLIVDHATDSAYALAQALRAKGLDTQVISDAGEALEYAKSSRPAMMFVAAELQGQSGYTLCSTVKRMKNLRDVPFVIMSDSEDAKNTFDQHRQNKTRADAYFIKPIDLDGVWREIGPLLKSAGALGADGGVQAIDVTDEADVLEDTGGDGAAGEMRALTPPGGLFSIDDFLANLDKSMESLEAETKQPPPAPDAKKKPGVDWRDDKITLLRENMKKRANQVAQYKVAVQALRREFHNLQDAIGFRDNKIRDLARSKEESENRAAKFEAGLGHLTGEHEDLQAAHTRVREDLAKLEAHARDQAAEQDRKIAHVQELLGLAQQEKAAIEQEFTARSHEYNERIERLTTEKAEIIQARDAQAATLQDQIDAKTTELRETREALEALRSDAEAAMQEAARVRDGLERKLADFEGALALAHRSADETAQRHREAIDNKNAEIAALHQKAAEEAKNFARADKELKERIEGLLEDLDTVTQQKAELEEELIRQRETLEGELAHTRNSYEAALSETRAQAQAVQARLEGEIEALAQQLEDARAHIEDLKQIRVGLEATEAALHEQVVGLENQLATLQNDYAELQKAKLDSETHLNGIIASLEDRVANLDGELADTRAAAAAKQAELEGTVAALESNVQGLENNLEATIAARDDLANHLETARAEIKRLNAELEDTRAHLTAQLTAAKGEYAALLDEHNGLQARHAELSAARDRLEQEFIEHVNNAEQEAADLMERAATADLSRQELQDQLARAQAENKQGVTALQQQLAHAKTEHQREIEAARQRVADTEQRIKKVREEAESVLLSRDQILATLREEKEALGNRFQALEVTAAQRQTEIERLKQRIGEIESGGARHLESVQAKLSQELRERDEAMKKLGRDLAQAKIDHEAEAKRLNQAHEAAQKSLRAELAETTQAIADSDDKLAKLRAETAAGAERIRTLERELETANLQASNASLNELKLAEMRVELEEAKSSARKNEDRVIKAYTKIKESNKLIEDLRGELGRLRAAAKEAGVNVEAVQTVSVQGE